MSCKGGYKGVGRYHDDVLTFNSTDETWTKVSTMREPRNYHAASVVQEDQIIDYCNQEGFQ